MDLNYDDQCKDAFYCLHTGVPRSTAQRRSNGLVNPTSIHGRHNRIIFVITARSWSGPPGRTGKLIRPIRPTDTRQQGQRFELAVTKKVKGQMLNAKFKFPAKRAKGFSLQPSAFSLCLFRLHAHRAAGGHLHPRHPGGAGRAGAQKFRQVERATSAPRASCSTTSAARASSP